MANRREKRWKSFQISSSWALKLLWWCLKKMIASWKKSYDKPRQCVEKQRHCSAYKGLYSQGYGLSSGHVQLWELVHKEGRAPKNWSFRTVVLEKTPESPLDSKKINPVNLKRNQPWILAGRTDAEALVFWLSNANSQLIGKVLDAGKDWEQKKRVSEDEMARWDHWCNWYELGQTLGDGEGQEGLACCSHVVAELDMTGQLNNNSNANIHICIHISTHIHTYLPGSISLVKPKMIQSINQHEKWFQYIGLLAQCY